MVVEIKSNIAKSHLDFPLQMGRPRILVLALCFLIILEFHFSIAADTLVPNQTLADGEILTSPAEIFELGFFGNSTSRFLGIRYKATPDVVVWVANRETPINGSHGVLALAKTGSLMLTSTQGSTIWVYNSSMAASSPVLQLLDSGNLVIVDKHESYMWQSFDYPCDTRLPGMKMVDDPDTGEGNSLTSWRSADDPSVGEFSYRIENHGLSQFTIRKGGEKTYRTIFWGGHFVGFPNLGDQVWKTVAASKKGRLISVYNPINESLITRITMNYSVFLTRYVMNEQKDGWVSMLSSPRDSCDSYGKCGPNGFCKIYEPSLCECLRGFKPRSEEEWEMYEWGSGCYRDLPLDCKNGDGFVKVEGVKFPDSLSFQLNSSMSIDECGDECLKKCNCTAYADPYSDGESNCLMWFGDLIDMREQKGEAGAGPTVYIRVAASELENTTDSNRRRRGPARSKFIFIAAAAAASGFGLLILGLAFGSFLVRRRRRKRRASEEVKEELELPLFNLATIAAATNNFSDENILGEGGFGPVFKGNLSVGQVVAVKRMSRTSGQGPEEFKNEVILIAKLQHRNLVRILGCCTEGEEKMLIYEYMQNKSLDYFIFDKSRSAILTWPKRFIIILGIAKGLLYLHHDSRLKVIHRDLKASNILLDENLNAKISDFGLARMFEGDQTTEKTERVMGTYGYMAPEYAYDGKFSIKSDIFSLGVVILEIVSGKRNRGFKHPSCFQNLLEQAWVLCMETRELELMDPSYKSSYVEDEVKRCIQVGLLCVQNAVEDRPVMSSVFLMLSSEDAVLPRPKKPGFFMQNSCSFSDSNTSRSKKSSCGAITMSDIEAR